MNDQEIRARVEKLKRAVHDPGINPEYHRQQLRKLATNWPTLYKAVRSLTDGEG